MRTKCFGYFGVRFTSKFNAFQIYDYTINNKKTRYELFDSDRCSVEHQSRSTSGSNLSVYINDECAIPSMLRCIQTQKITNCDITLKISGMFKQLNM